MTDFPRPSVTVDCVVFHGDSVLLVTRGKEPHLGQLALPGGFVNPYEAVEDAAARELAEETGLTGLPLQLIGVFNAEDPRGWIITVAFGCDASGLGRLPEITAGDDAAAAAWVPLVDVYARLGFPHHRRILNVARLTCR